MELTTSPRADLAVNVLPAPLWRGLCHIFAQGLTDVMLVGGTALAGFYAGHRRSDDLDLFAGTPAAYRAAVLASQSLSAIGARLTSAQHTAQYYRAVCHLQRHHFTVDVVLDENLFRVGAARYVEPNIMVASLETLVMTKAATLVSRCSEKDLYDLLWLVTEVEGIELADLVSAGQRIDAGVDAEAILLVITGTQPSASACGFAVEQGHSPDEVFAAVEAFKAALHNALVDHLQGLPVPPLGRLVRKIRRVARSAHE